MIAPDYIYTLIEEDFTQHVLTHVPIGWEDMEVMIGRSETYHGIFRSLSMELKFAKEGASLIRQLHIDFGVQAILIFKIEQRQNDFTYLTFYQGTLDFSSFKEMGDYVKINSLEGGIAEQIKAREEVVYALPIEDGQEIQINYQGVAMSDRVIYANDNFIAGTQIGIGPAFQKHILALMGGFIDNTSGAVIMKDQLVAGSSYFIYATRRCKIRIHAAIVFDFYYDVPATGVKARIGIGRVGVTSFAHTFWEKTYPPGTGNDFEHAIGTSDIIEMDAGEYWELICETDEDGTNYFDFATIMMRVDIIAQLPEVSFFAQSPVNVFMALMDKIIPGVTVEFGSELGSAAQYIIMTCGDAIRDIDKASLKISLKEFFQFMNAKFCVGLGMYLNSGSPVVIMDFRANFYLNAEMISIGAVRDFSYYPANDLQYSHIKIGTKPQTDMDENNGKDEPNTTFQWTTPLTKRPNTLEMISPYRDDMYGVDMHRIKYLNSADDQQAGSRDEDNPIFILACIDDPGAGGEYIVERLHYTIIDGITFPDEALNIRLSPGRCIRRAGGWIHSGLIHHETELIAFASCDKNPRLKSSSFESPSTITIDEDADITVSTLDRTIFYPYYFEFTAPVPDTFFDLASKYPYEYITFTFKGYTFRGFLIEARINPTSKEATTWKLLCTNTVTLQNLVDAHESY